MNPFGATSAATQHQVLARLRQAAPVHRVALPNGSPVWLVTRYADVRAALGDLRLSSVRRAEGVDRGALAPQIRAAMSTHMMRADPPDHTRLRRLVSAAFIPRRIAALRPRIRQITGELLDQMAGRDRVDLVADYAAPLPMRVTCELLGVPDEDHPRFRDWSTAFIAGVGAPVFPVDEVTAFVGYLRELISRKRATPDDGLLSALVAARDAADRLSEDELTSTVFLLIIAGHASTVDLIGNGLYLLLGDPARADRVRADLHDLPTVVEEFLRYEPPVPAAALRIVTEPVNIAGTVIPAGQMVLISLMAANRDPAAFTDPDSFTIDRPASPHLAFGHGIHYCLGAPLARLEAQIALDALLQRHPRLRLGVAPDQLRWQPAVFRHGLVELPAIPR
jgi:cytochrome P450